MTHPHPPICLSREKLLGFRTHTEGPFYLRPKPGPLVECRSALLYRIYCLAGGQVAPLLAEGRAGARLSSAAQRMGVSLSTPTWSCCWQGWVSACLLMQGHILDWAGWWRLKIVMALMLKILVIYSGPATVLSIFHSLFQLVSQVSSYYSYFTGEVVCLGSPSQEYRGLEPASSQGAASKLLPQGHPPDRSPGDGAWPCFSPA